MNITLRLGCAFLTLVLGMLQGCAQGRDPFLIVQVCLGNAQGVALFKDTMKSIAESQHMRYIDGSREGSRNSDVRYKAIFLGVERKDTMGLTAGNFGLGAYQVAIGFNFPDGSNPAEAHQFANMVVRRLKKKWHVYVVPPGRGALPMKTCGGK
jgi:hypothetical protein